MKRLFIVSLRLVALVVVGAVLVVGSCTAPKGEGFAIYLTRDDVPPSKMPMLSHVDIEEKPMIAIGDLVTYNGSTHEIVITSGAYKRITDMRVPLSGKSFVVCVDRKPIYWGAFWTPISSYLFPGIIIMQPPSTQSATAIKLELVYSGESFFNGEDPRANAEVMKSLQQAGKLQ